MPNHCQSCRKTPWTPQQSLFAILALFFLWGFLTCLNDILLPHFWARFHLSYAASGLIPFTFFTTCFLFAPVAAAVIGRLGYLGTMVTGLAIMGCGALAFLPAAWFNRYACFLAAIGVIGVGITILQAAAAPYVAALGPQEGAPGRFSLALAFNSLGTMVAPLFGSWLILESSIGIWPFQHTVQSAAAQSASVLGPYLLLGIMLLLLAVAVAVSGLPRLQPPVSEGDKPSFHAVIRHKPLVWGALTAFLYAGAEIGIGSYLILYLTQPLVLGVSRHTAAILASLYWGGAVTGRLAGARLLRRYRVERTLAVVATCAGALVFLSSMTQGWIAAGAILAVGLCNALIVPIVVMLAISGLGPLTSQASAVMVSANVGAALVPLAIGYLADRIGVQHALAATALCYAFAVFYALRGSRGHLLRQTRYNANANRRSFHREIEMTAASAPATPERAALPETWH